MPIYNPPPAGSGGGGGGVPSITGTANQVLVNGGTGTVTTAATLSLPQDIDTTSSPQFANVTVSGQVSTMAFATDPPNTITSNYTVTDVDCSIICKGSGTITLTLPDPALNVGRWLYLMTKVAKTVVSASSNVVGGTATAASTAILAATIGKWAALCSDGTYWQVVMNN